MSGIDVSPSLALIILVGVLIGAGVYLLMERTLTRIIIGASLLTHGTNLMILMAGGRAGSPPIIGESAVEEMADPLPQALILTCIVIGLALTAFLAAMAYRSWQLNGHDEVQDDVEDRRIARQAAADEVEERVTDDAGQSVEQEAATTYDETSGHESELETEGEAR